MLDLNGHTLTVTGNLIQSGGNMLVNGGELDVQGDYHIQALNNGSYIPSMGTLTMTDDSDIVKVCGNFLMQSTQSHENLLSAGTLMVAGDLKQISGGSEYNFYTSGTHTVVFNGLKKQTISIYNSGMYYSRITNLKIENTSAEGVDVTSAVYISGKLYNTDSIVTNSINLCITAMTEFPDGRWNYDANFTGNKTISSCLEIGGSVYINSSLILENNASVDNDTDNYSLMVDGDIWLCSGLLNINKGKLYVGGDFNISSKNKSYSGGCLYMRNSEDYILVNGDVYVYSTRDSELTAGTLEVKGDFTQKYYGNNCRNNFYCRDNHKIILSGEKPQTVYFESTQSQFNILEVQNFSDGGVTFATLVPIVKLIDNNCKVSFADGGLSGWTLEDNEVIDGDLNLSGGTLDLNGHKLTITGSLIQSGGNVFVNGGELNVQGDYRIQKLNESGYTESSGTLTMKNDSDAVKVGGDFVMQSTQSHDGLLSAGTLEVSGDLTRKLGGTNYGLYASGTHTTVLNGFQKQTLHLYGSNITNLKIENTSADGVDIISAVFVDGKLYNTDSIVTNSSNLFITESTEFPDNRWNYDMSFYRNRTISSGLSIGGSVYVNSSLTLEKNPPDNAHSVNDYSLKVEGDVWICSGTLNINDGKLYIGGDFNLSSIDKENSYGYLYMQNTDGYIFVNGNMYVHSINRSSSYYYDKNKLTAGTIEIKGDFTQRNYDYYSKSNFYCSDNHRVILSGNKLQTISFASTYSQFNILDVQNFSEDGVAFSTAATVVELLDNGCNILFSNGERSGWTLEEDEIIDGDLNLSRGTLDLNGHTLTVTGNLIQAGGNMLVNGGELNIQGDYRVQTLSGDSYAKSTGTLTMQNDSDIVKIGGDFIMESTKSHDGLLSAGIMEISGNLTQPSGGSSNNFCTSGTHTVVLNGSEKQIINIDSSSHFTNLKIENTSAEGVDFGYSIRVLEKLYNTNSVVSNSSNLYIAATTEFPDNRWNYDASFKEDRTISNNLSFGGSVYIYASITLENDTSDDGSLNIDDYLLTVEGDVWLHYGTLDINNGGLYVGGDLNLSSIDKRYSNSYLNMQNEKGHVLVNGNMYVYSSESNSKLTAGTIEIKGDFTQKCFNYNQDNLYCSGSHKVILSGEKLQTVSFASTQSQFNVLDVQNFSEDGVVFSTVATIIDLFDNGCNVSFANGERSGWTLEEDEIIDGDLNLSRGTLNLNGRKLTVTGNLVQSGGNMLVNGGELDVQGGYRVQALNGGIYTTSPGTLTMNNYSDTVKVGGDFIMQSTANHDGRLTAGTLEIAGNLTQLSGGAYDNFCTTGTHTVVLNGSEKQTVSIANSNKNYSHIANLKIENTSEEGVNIASRVYILNKLYNTDSVVTGSSNLHITATTEFPDGRWNHDIYFAESRIIPTGLEIGGSMYIYATLSLSSDVLVDDDYSLTVDSDIWVLLGTLDINKGRLYVGGDLNFSNQYKDFTNNWLTMQNAEDYILVNGDMLFASYQTSRPTAGTLEVKGDFTQKYYYHSPDSFYCSGSHKVVLSGEKLQTISFASTQSQFNILEITKPFDVGYVFNDNAQWNELVENYTDDSAPAAPTNLQFVRSTSTSVMMRWTASADSGKLNRYEIYRDGKLVGTTKQTEFIDNGLNTHTQYEYYIVALGANGVRSENSNTIKAATDVDAYAPTTPTGLQAVIRTDGSVYLTWIASSDNVSVDGYNLYRNGEYIGNTAGTAYNDKNAELGYHEYYVEAFDNEGNNSLFSDSVYADNMPPQKPVLHISEITPMRITFKWNSEDNVEIDHFEIYKNDEFFKKTKSSEYTDTAVTAGDEYSYYVVAIDTSGNVSEASDTKKIFAKNDEEKPQIGIAAQTLTETSKSLRIVCTDDVMLSELNAEIKAPSSEEWSSVKTQTLSQKSQFVNLDLSDYLTDSGEYDIRISVADAAGNTETVESKFTYAKNEMSEFEVTAVADGCSVRLDWTSASDSSDVYYEIRRKDADGTEKYIATTRADELSYTDSGLYPLAKYSYYVVAHDDNLYTVKSNTADVTSGKDTIAPIAHAGNSSVTIAGQTVKFDGSRSSDNFGIKEYSWDFGDGSTGSGKTASHIYSEAGTYTATLIVTDESGNSNADTTTVIVYGKDYSITEIQIKDDSGRILPSAAAYCELPDIEETTFYSDDSGIISLVAMSGTYDFCFFANECLPAKQSITLDGISTGTERKTVTLTKSELVTAEFNITELDIEKVESLGIDVTAPENQYVSKVEMKIQNNIDGSNTDEDLSKFNVYVNQTGEIIMIEHNDSFTAPVYGVLNVVRSSSKDDVKSTSSVSTLGIGMNNNLSNNNSKHVLKLINGTMVTLSVTEYSWLKDFYEVSITFTNNSDSGFDIVNPKATLKLPNGLSLANTERSNPTIQIMNTIEGGTSETVSWTVKGDSKGSYNISVDFEGVLSPFGIPVEAKFTNSQPINVIGGDALKLNISAKQYYADFMLTNVSDGNVYNAKINIDGYAELNDAYRIIAKYPSGLIEKIEWADESRTELKSTIYLPVNVEVDADIFALRTLKQGESIEGKMWYLSREVGSTD